MYYGTYGMDKYTVVGEMGQGTYGTVSECVDDTTGRTVAVKKLRNPIYDSRHCEMIVREISILRKLSDDHVVPMVGAFRHRGLVHMVFPIMWCNLYKYLELNGGALTVDRTRECMFQVGGEIVPSVMT